MFNMADDKDTHIYTTRVLLERGETQCLVGIWVGNFGDFDVQHGCAKMNDWGKTDDCTDSKDSER